MLQRKKTEKATLHDANTKREKKRENKQISFGKAIGKKKQ